MRNETFIRLAHRRSVLKMLQDMLLEKHIGDEVESPILCEEVPFADRFVSQGALLDVLDGLAQLEAVEELRMSKFELRERSVPPLAMPLPPKEESNVTEEPPVKANPPSHQAEAGQAPTGSTPTPEGGSAEPSGAGAHAARKPAVAGRGAKH